MFAHRMGVVMAASLRAMGGIFSIPTYDKPFVECGDYAVVDIVGPLTQHPMWCGDSYDEIRARVCEALASSCPKVCLRINSPGGDFVGSIELANELRAKAASSGKELVAFTDAQALSAGYILACAASRIVGTPSAFLGSIGVWSQLVDESKRDAAMGIGVYVASSGSRKVDRNPHVPLTEDAIGAAQAQVDAMASLFFEHVNTSRGIDVAAIEKLQGAELFGAAAMQNKLLDQIVNDWSTFISGVGSGGKGKAMADMKDTEKQIDEAMAALKAVEGDDEESKKARKALRAKAKKALDEMAASEDGDGEEKSKADAEKEKAKAASDDDGDGDGDTKKEKAKAEADEEKEKAKAMAATGMVPMAQHLALVAQVHAMQAQTAKEKESVERAKLLASRPDFSPAVKASLAKADLSFVRDAVAKWERGPLAANAAAATPGGTRGATQGTQEISDIVAQSEADYIAARMGGSVQAKAIEMKGHAMSFGFMTPEAAAKRAKELEAESAKGVR